MYRLLKLLHRILKSKSPKPKYLRDNFTFLSKVSALQIRRGTSLLVILTNRTSIYSKYFTITTSRIWNSLPKTIWCLDKNARFGAEIEDLLRGRQV